MEIMQKKDGGGGEKRILLDPPVFCAGVGIRLPLSPLGIPRGTFLLCAKTIDVSVNTISLLAPLPRVIA